MPDRLKKLVCFLRIPIFVFLLESMTEHNKPYVVVVVCFWPLLLCAISSYRNRLSMIQYNQSVNIYPRQSIRLSILTSIFYISHSSSQNNSLHSTVSSNAGISSIKNGSGSSSMLSNDLSNDTFFGRSTTLALSCS